MDTSYIDIHIQQENTRHEQEIIRIEKAKQAENDLHKRKIDNFNSQKERLRQQSKNEIFEKLKKSIDKALS